MDNLIFITGGNDSEIKLALNKWFDFFCEEFKNDLIFKFHKIEDKKHIINADEKLDNDSFFTLINYLNYPEEMSHQMDIQGFTVGKKNNRLKGKKLQVYIPKKDREYDNVFLTTSDNENFKITFGKRMVKTTENRIYNEPNYDNFKTTEILTFRNEKESEEFKFKKTVKRFKIISFVLSIFIISIFIFYFLTNNENLFLKLVSYMGVGIGFWFYIDEILHKKLNTVKWCLYLSIIYASIVIFLFNYFGQGEFYAFAPISFLVVKIPLRLLFKWMFKREPSIEDSANFANKTYGLILLLGALFISFRIHKYFFTF